MLKLYLVGLFNPDQLHFQCKPWSVKEHNSKVLTEGAKLRFGNVFNYCPEREVSMEAEFPTSFCHFRARHRIGQHTSKLRLHML